MLLSACSRWCRLTVCMSVSKFASRSIYCLPRVSSPFFRAGEPMSAPSTWLSALQSTCHSNCVSAWLASLCAILPACHRHVIVKPRWALFCAYTCPPALPSACLYSTAMCSCLSFTPPSPPTFHQPFYLSIQEVLNLPVNLLVNKTTYLSAGLSERLPSCPSAHASTFPPAFE